MLIHNDYRRYNVNAKMTLTPTDWARIDVGMEAARQESKMPYSTVDPFYYAFFSNPYERAYNADGSYAADNTWFTLGYYNGRGAEQVMPKTASTSSANWIRTTARPPIRTARSGRRQISEL